MNEESIKVGIEYYKMGKETERQILLNILKYGLEYKGIDKLIQIREAMEQFKPE